MAAAIYGAPWVIRAIECTGVTVRGVTLQNSSMWMQHYQACDDVVVDGVTVRNYNCKQSNCLTLDGCHLAHVANCNFASCDDCFELKSLSSRSCKNITVTNCSFTGNCNGFKLGTESMGGFENIAISNCTFENIRLAAVAVELVDGGTLDRVSASDLVMHNVGAAVLVRLGNRGRHLSGEEKPGVGVLRNVSFHNIQATGVGRCFPRKDMVYYTPDDPSDEPLPPDKYTLTNRYGLSITGLPGHSVENVSLSDIRLEFIGGGTTDDIKWDIEEKPDAYPECNMFGVLPAYGFYVRHARKIAFENISMAFEVPDSRPAIACDDVEGISIRGLNAELSQKAPAAILLRNTRDVLLEGCRIACPLASFVKHEGPAPGSMLIVGNLLPNTKRLFTGDEEAAAGSVVASGNYLEGQHVAE